ncbi:MAG: DUF3999 family protein [Chloroflexi bacterium]|nr:DUF3999 family protein [Chloroflexota bacterium]
MIAIVLLLVPSRASADFSPRGWRYFKLVALPSGLTQEGLVEMVLDLEVFGGSAPGLADLRLISSEEEEVPYKLEIARGTQERAVISAFIQDRGYLPGQYSFLVADLGREGVLHNQIEISVATRDFLRKAVVETSSNNVNWTQVAEGQIFDVTLEGGTFRQIRTNVTYPETTARYVRVRIPEAEGGPLDVRGVAVAHVKEVPAVETLYPATVLEQGRDAQNKLSYLVLALRAKGIPTSCISLDISQVNFYRQVTIEASEDRKAWTRLGPGSPVYSFDTPKFVGKDLSVPYPETTWQYLRVNIHDQDNPPLNVARLEVNGVQRRLIFQARPGQGYKLYFGNSDASRPSYDIEKVLPYLLTGGLPQAQLGPRESNAAFVEKLAPVSERFPWLLPLVVAGAAVALALLLLGVIRQARKALPPKA